MPRSSNYLLPGYTYHLTQRCHGHEFLLRFAKDRDTCQKWLREGVQRYRVPVYGYCITSNHIHVLAHRIETRQAYTNRRKFDLAAVPGNQDALWFVKEPQIPYNAVSIPKKTF